MTTLDTLNSLLLNPSLSKSYWSLLTPTIVALTITMTTMMTFLAFILTKFETPKQTTIFIGSAFTFLALLTTFIAPVIIHTEIRENQTLAITQLNEVVEGEAEIVEIKELHDQHKYKVYTQHKPKVLLGQKVSQTPQAFFLTITEIKEVQDQVFTPKNIAFTQH